VAPFVGLLNLAMGRADPGGASALWYWALIWAGAQVGASWDEIQSFVGQLNLTLAIMAATASVALGIWIWRRVTRQVPERRRLLLAIRRAIVPGAGGSPSAADVDIAAQGAAAIRARPLRPAIPREQQR
jgi:hypothetical protein